MEENREKEAIADDVKEGARGASGKQKKGVLILLAVVLAALLLVAALIAVDFEALFGMSNDDLLKRPDYYEADYNENIFENEEYMKHAFSGMKISVKEEGNYSKVYPFGDRESAEEAFGEAAGHKYGAGVLSDYFYTLLNGCNTKGKRERFFALFAEDYRIVGEKNSAPGTFPQQKIYDLYFEYVGESAAYDGTVCYEWYVSYRVIRNDGTVLNYSSGLDNGQARFFVELQEDGSYRIKEIVGIFQLN
jgi:hypothetical protein